MRVLRAAVVILAFMCGPPARAEAPPDTPAPTSEARRAPVLRGRAVLLRPLTSAYVTIAEVGGGVLQTSNLPKLFNGVMAVPLAKATLRALDAGRDLRVRVRGRTAAGGGDHFPITVELAADLHRFRPRRDVVRVDLVSTLISTVRTTAPDASYREARRKVYQALGAGAGAGSGAACAPTLSTALFAPRRFLGDARGMSRGQLGQLVQKAARRILAGERLRLGDGSSTDPETAAIQALAVDLLKASGNKAAGEVTGWVLDTMFSSPDATAAQLAEIQSQLNEISDQLTVISQQLDALEAQVAALADLVRTEANYTVYQTEASDLQKDINQLCSLQNQLILLSQSDPSEDQSAFITTLRNNIQTYADTDLRDIQTTLLGSAQFTGLIDLWGGLNGTGTGYPLLFANAYLAKAIPNLDYYIGAQVVALNLISEQGHYDGGSLGQNTVNDAVRRYFIGVDQQTIALAAKKKLPNGRYPALQLASDEVTVDSRSGLMWQRTNLCHPYTAVGQPQNAISSCYWTPLAGDPDAPYYGPDLAAFDTGGLTGWRLPVGSELKALYGARGSQSPAQYLNAQGIVARVDGLFIPFGTGGNYWVSDVCQYPDIFGNLSPADCIADVAVSGNIGPSLTCVPYGFQPGCFNTLYDKALVLGARVPDASEFYQSICNASGQCFVPCGDDGELCPLPGQPAAATARRAAPLTKAAAATRSTLPGR